MNIALIGDVMLGRLVNQTLKNKPPEYPWGDTLPIFQSADWRACNLECVISDRGRPWSEFPKPFHFRSDAKNVGVLVAAGINAVSVANNHSLDFEHDAMLEMLRLLDEAGIAHSGAGASRDEATRPVYDMVNGITIGFVAFTDNHPEWESGPAQPGIFFVPTNLSDERAQMLLQAVRKAKEHAGLLIVSAHWGGNWGYVPPDEHFDFGRALIESGADVVFGHSAHVFRGIEIYESRPILYSTGDFTDDYAVDEIEKNDESFIYTINTVGTKITGLRLYPTVIREFQARLARDGEARVIAGKMTSLCTDLGTRAEWSKEDECLRIDLQNGGGKAAAQAELVAARGE